MHLSADEDLPRMDTQHIGIGQVWCVTNDTQRGKRINSHATISIRVEEIGRDCRLADDPPGTSQDVSIEDLLIH